MRLLLRCAPFGYCPAALAPAVSVDRDAIDLIEAGHAHPDLVDAGLAKAPDAFPDGLRLDVHRVAARHDDAPHLFGERHHLVQTRAALIPVRALRATDGGVNLEAVRDFLLAEAFLEQGLGRDDH